MSTEIEILQKRISEITSLIRELYEDLQELESERAELEDYKSTLVVLSLTGNLESTKNPH